MAVLRLERRFLSFLAIFSISIPLLLVFRFRIGSALTKSTDELTFVSPGSLEDHWGEGTYLIPENLAFYRSVDVFPALASKVLPETNAQDRSRMRSDQRAESARCNGILHACANWMALHATKMRIVLFKEGRWCTDDDLQSKACYKEGLHLAQDKVVDIPDDGTELSDEIWELIQKSCPMIENCPKPERYSSTEATSFYKPHGSQVLTSLLTTAVRDQVAVDLQSQCCFA